MTSSWRLDQRKQIADKCLPFFLAVAQSKQFLELIDNQRHRRFNQQIDLFMEIVRVAQRASHKPLKPRVASSEQLLPGLRIGLQQKCEQAFSKIPQGIFAGHHARHIPPAGAAGERALLQFGTNAAQHQRGFASA